MLTQIILHILAFLGIGAGFIVAQQSWDELKDGTKYFTIIKGIILLCLIIVTGLTQTINITLILLFALGIILGVLIKQTYLFLGIISITSILSTSPLLPLSLIFLYGIPEGTLWYYHHKQEKLKKITLISLALFFASLIILFFPSASIISGIALGALSTKIYDPNTN